MQASSDLDPSPGTGLADNLKTDTTTTSEPAGAAPAAPAGSVRRLAYLVPEFPGQTHIFFWREITALRKAGIAVTLVSTRKPTAACAHDFATPAAAETHYVYPPAAIGSILALLARPVRTLRAIGYLLGLKETPFAKRLTKLGYVLCAADLMKHLRRNGCEHLHIHSCADAAHIGAICRILGGPSYSLTLHGDLPVYGVDHKSKMRLAACVTCVTRPLQKQVTEQIGLPIDRLPVIWMGVDTDQFKAASNVTRGTSPGRLHMVTVARLNIAKGHIHALNAMHRALDAGLDVRYTIAGEGPNRDQIVADIARLQLSDRVEMPGTLSESRVRELLQRADAFMLPSIGLGEAAPVSVMEAMACGLPVICSIIGGTLDMITSGEDGILVKQQDETGLCDAITLLARDPEERRRLGQAARQRAQRQFDSRVTSMQLLSAIESNR